MCPLSPSCFSDSQVFWMLIPICLHPQKEPEPGECLWGVGMGQVWKDAHQVLSCSISSNMVPWPQRGCKVPSQEGRTVKVISNSECSFQFISFSIIYWLFTTFQALCEQQPETRLSSILVWEKLWIHSTEDLLGSACHPRRKDEENAFWKFTEWF